MILSPGPKCASGILNLSANQGICYGMIGETSKFIDCLDLACKLENRKDYDWKFLRMLEIARRYLGNTECQGTSDLYNHFLMILNETRDVQVRGGYKFWVISRFTEYFKKCGDIEFADRCMELLQLCIDWNDEHQVASLISLRQRLAASQNPSPADDLAGASQAPDEQ